MSKRNQIKELFSEVNRKTTAIQAVSDKTGIRFSTIKQSWLCDSGGWSVPKEHQETVIERLKAVIDSQKRVIVRK